MLRNLYFIFGVFYTCFLVAEKAHISNEEIMLSLFPECVTAEMKYITVGNTGQLGNQCFRVATGISWAIDKGYFFVIAPEVKNMYPEIFHRIPIITPVSEKKKIVNFVPIYKPFPFIKSSALVKDFPWSTYYFQHNAEVIRELFKPKSMTVKKLKAKFQYVLDNQESYVGLHLRTFVTKNDSKYLLNLKDFVVEWGITPLFYETAIECFDQNAIFLVFTDNIPAAREMLAIFDRKFIFSEGTLEEDFYMISMMDRMIVCNSTFSTFAAFLNPNPEKQVVMPKGGKWIEIADPDWIRLDVENIYKHTTKEYQVWHDIRKKYALEKIKEL
jgi:hypothetical protein